MAISNLPLRVPEKYAELRPIFDLLRRAILTRIEEMAVSGDSGAAALRFAQPVGYLSAPPVKVAALPDIPQDVSADVRRAQSELRTWRFMNGGP